MMNVDGLTGTRWIASYNKKRFLLNEKVFKIKLNFKK